MAGAGHDHGGVARHQQLLGPALLEAQRAGQLRVVTGYVHVVELVLGQGQDAVSVRLDDVRFVDSGLLYVGGRVVDAGLRGRGALGAGGGRGGRVQGHLFLGPEPSARVGPVRQAVRSHHLQRMPLDVVEEGLAGVEGLEGEGQGNGGLERSPGRGGRRRRPHREGTRRASGGQHQAQENERFPHALLPGRLNLRRSGGSVRFPGRCRPPRREPPPTAEIPGKAGAPTFTLRSPSCADRVTLGA